LNKLKGVNQRGDGGTEGKWKREERRGKREEGREKREEGRRKREEGRGKWEKGREYGRGKREREEGGKREAPLPVSTFLFALRAPSLFRFLFLRARLFSFGDQGH
jgi:hypothetical protein